MVLPETEQVGTPLNPNWKVHVEVVCTVS